MEYQKKSYHMEAVCGSAHYQIAAYWSRVLNKPAIKAYQASRRGIVLTANYTATQKGVKKCLSGSGCCSAQNGALSTVFFHAAGDLWRVYRSGGALWIVMKRGWM